MRWRWRMAGPEAPVVEATSVETTSTMPGEVDEDDDLNYDPCKYRNVDGKDHSQHVLLLIMYVHVQSAACNV